MMEYWEYNLIESVHKYRNLPFFVIPVKTGIQS